MATCKAAVFVGAGRPLEVQEFPVLDVVPGSALVEMRMAAVCGTDVHAWHNPAAPHPVIFGHENVGVIAGLGRGIESDVLGQPLKEGDRIIFRSTPCGRCDNCAIGVRCRNNENYGFIPADRPPYLRGGFGQYLYLDADPWILRVPDSMTTERALLAVIGCHTVMHGVERIGGLSVGHTVVVQGSGPIGMGALTVARISGASRVIVIGAPAARLALARELGADETVDLADYAEPAARVARVQELTGGRGADFVVECSGGDTAVQEGLQMARMGGKYLVVGQFTDYGPKAINPSLVVRKSLLLSGVYGSTARHIIRSVEAMSSVVTAPVEKLITHQYPLERVNEAFHAHETLEAMVAVLLPNG
ncbi:MAG: zinc-binding dehydrogenase [Chloroflexi bacterium]|nr:zinc-binding dehydrogenase [Chloroflexota bacterium]